MRRSLPLASSALAAMLLLGACGGDDSDDATPATEVESTVDGSDTTDDTDTTTDDTDTTTDTTDDDTSTTVEFSGDDSGQLCDLMEDLSERSDEIGNLSEMTEPEEFESAFNEVDDVLDQAIDRAPDEIRDDFETISEAYDEFRAVLEDYDFDVSALIADAAANPQNMERLDVLRSPEVDAASARIDQYSEDVCGIDVDG
jgi:flagellin-like hook-associated protein FlgL